MGFCGPRAFQIFASLLKKTQNSQVHSWFLALFWRFLRWPDVFLTYCRKALSFFLIFLVLKEDVSKPQRKSANKNLSRKISWWNLCQIIELDLVVATRDNTAKLGYFVDDTVNFSIGCRFVTLKISSPKIWRMEPENIGCFCPKREAGESLPTTIFSASMLNFRAVKIVFLATLSNQTAPFRLWIQAWAFHSTRRFLGNKGGRVWSLERFEQWKKRHGLFRV